MARGLAVLACGFLAGAALAQKSNTAEHVSNAGKYSVVFPLKPSKVDADKSLATAAGNLAVVTSKAETSGAVYSVTYTDYPTAFREVSPARILEQVVAGMKGTDGEVSWTDDFTLDGATGRQVNIVAGENMVKAKVVLADTRLYLVQVSGKKEAVKGRAGDDFLASFALRK
jgi:hypothetical protein